MTDNGEVQAVTVLKRLSSEYDAAVEAAIRQLPTFVASRNGCQPVSVSYTVPIRFVWKIYGRRTAGAEVALGPAVAVSAAF